MHTSTMQDLGPDFAAKLGAYIQTCARIEYQVALIICAIEKVPQNTNEWRSRHNKLRAQHTTRELISKLSSSAKKLENNHLWRNYLNGISGWMHRFVSNRHKAVHGLIKKEGEGLIVRASDKDSDEETIVLVSKEDISEMMDDAQKILNNLEDCLDFLSASVRQNTT